MPPTPPHHASVIETIGNTPLIKLRRASEETGCLVLGKAEFLNPGQSIKDRAALGIIRDAEKTGALRPGGTIIEGTAGNTGIGLCVVGRALGYRVRIVIPNNQSLEKKMAIRLAGGDLIEVDPAPYTSQDHFVHVSRRLVDEARAAGEDAVWANQFDNTANRAIHEATTGVEIWAQTDGRVDGFVSTVGSGGTIAGVSRALKARNTGVKIALADPGGARIYSWVKNGTLESEGTSIMEGIGQSRVTDNLDGASIDEAYRIEDARALNILYRLTLEEGMSLGGSAGINIAGAHDLARAMGPGHTIVTMLCDYGNRYSSTMYNPLFLRERGLPLPPWEGDHA